MKLDARKGPSWHYVTLWYVTSLILLWLLAARKFGFAFWRLPAAQLLPLGFLATAFVLSAVVALLRPALRGWGVARVLVSTMAIFGAVFLAFVLTQTEFSRAFTVAVLGTALLFPVPYFVGDSRLQQALAFAGLLAAALVGPLGVRSMRDISEQAPRQTSSLIRTEFYNLEVDAYSGIFPKSAVRGGALARIGDGYLALTGDGHLYLFDWGTEDGPKVQMLPYRVPINGEAFSAAAGRPWAEDRAPGPAQEEQRVQAGHEILNAEWFRTYGLLVQDVGPNTRIFVSHDYWNVAQECWTERVSMLEEDRAAILRGEQEVGSVWKTLYETTPCLPVRGEDRRHGIPFVGYFGGGRMALLDAETLLLTVGDFGFDGAASIHAYPQDPAASYGKTIAIKIADGSAKVFTLGHRNPQGLYIDQSGTIWSTEHGPQGGDELNRLVRGENYGWPYATDGTDYGSFSWPLNKPESEQKDYQAPVFAWVPSIAVSNLAEIEHDLFSQWRGDLLIGSLKAKTLFRARVRDGRVRYLEAIEIGSSIRDIIEGHDGRLVLLTDEQAVISLRPKEGTSGEALFAEKCSGCHQSSLISGSRIGPNLFGIVGRRVASIESYPDYSQGLRRLGGEWTEKRLDEFLASPGTMCPGTNMDFAGDASATERKAIVSYLRTLQ